MGASPSDTFKLAMGCLEGSRYVAMIEKVTSINSGFLEQFAEMRKENIGIFDVMLKVFHMLTHPYVKPTTKTFSTFFQVGSFTGEVLYLPDNFNLIGRIDIHPGRCHDRHLALCGL